MVTMELLLLIVGVFLGTGIVNAQECSREDLRRCRADIITSMETQNRNSDKLQLEEQCKTLRENMDCVVGQTAMCLREDEQDSNSDIIWKTWRYLGSFCDKFGNWWANSCFQREDLKRCETQLPSNSRSLDNVACRNFVNFRDCVTSIVYSKCRSEVRSFLVTYLVDRGQEKAWRCPKNPQVSLTRFDSAPLAADSRQTSNRYPMMMADNPFSSGNTCLLGLMNKENRCVKTVKNAVVDARKEDDTDIRKHKMCCASVHFIDCLRDFLKEECGAETAKQAENFASQLQPLTGGINVCKDHTRDMCSGAFVGRISLLSLILTVISAIFVGRL